MKILFLANRTPYPPYRGDKLKIYHLAKRLAAKGHELHLLTFALDKDDLGHEDELKKIFAKVDQVYLPKWKSVLNCISALWNGRPLQVLYFQSAAMRKKLAALLSANAYDAVHVQHLRMAPYLAGNKSVIAILDLPDAFSLYWMRRLKMAKSLASRAFQLMEQKRLLAYEPVIKQYDLALACSNEDIDYLKEMHGVVNIDLLPNGVDLDNFHPGPHDYSHNKILLFTGNMDYAPNVDAVSYCCKEILPVIRKAHPQIQFIIAGQRPVPAVTRLAEEGVEVTGFIPNLAGMYDRASVVLAPLRFGAGTQNKVLEAMAMGVPVVCSEVGFAGLGINDGEGAFKRTDAAAFAQQVIALLDDEALRCATGLKGASIAKQRFGWDAVAARLEQYFELLSHHN